MAATPEVEENNQLNRCFIAACREPDEHETVTQMIEDGACVDACDGFLTPLLAAIVRGDLKMMSLLIAQDADINFCNPTTPPPLHFCIMVKQKAAFDLLIEKGAKTRGWENMPAYLDAFKEIHTFMQFARFMTDKWNFKNTPLDKANTCASNLIDPFSTKFEFFINAQGEHLCSDTYCPIYVGNLAFTVKIIPYKAKAPPCHKRHSCYGLFQKPKNTGVFVGLFGITPAKYEIQFAYYMEVKKFEHEPWSYGKSVLARITEKTTDWGYWNFEEFNEWNFCLTDGTPWYCRLSLALMSAKLG